MNRIRIALAPLLLLSLTVFCYAQNNGQSQASAQQAPVLNQEEPKHPDVGPPQQQPETVPAQKPEERPAPKEEKPEKSEKQETPKTQEQPKPSHEEHGKTMNQGARPAGKSAHIPDSTFKAKFGRQHTFKENQVIKNTTVVVNQTQFVSGGFTFVFLDPWPAGWLFTDDCFIDFFDDQYFLIDAFHPGVRVALFVVG